MNPIKANFKPNAALFLKYEQIAINLIKGRKMRHISSKSVFELMRITGNARLDNILTPYYSREFVRKHPKYVRYFEFRQIKNLVG